MAQRGQRLTPRPARHRGGASLAQLLAEKRGVRNVGALPTFHIKQILSWADDHRERTGAWPTSESGPIADAPGETWRAVDGGLRVGVRGLAPGSSLAQLLAKHRGQRNLQGLPPFTVRQILAWADAHHKRTGTWPTNTSGPIADAPHETWSAVNVALSNGRRGMPGRSSLAKLLAARRGVANSRQLPPFTLPKMRARARAYKKQTGRWPNSISGPVAGLPGTTWKHVCDALREGYRGLPGGQTLAALQDGDATNGVVQIDLPPLTDEQVLAWADAHHQRMGRWPHARSGPILEAPGETWRSVDRALHTGTRRPGAEGYARSDADATARLAHPSLYAAVAMQTNPGLGGRLPPARGNVAESEFGADSQSAGRELASGG